jgi:hypothetical protein
MRLKSLKRATFTLAAVGSVTAAKVVCAASTPLAGLSIENAIGVFERDGLRIFYSTDLVKPSMRVEAEPRAADPAAELAEILAAFGLTTQPGPNGSLLVVRGPERDDRADQSRELALPPNDDVPVEPPPRVLEEVVVTTSQYELRRAIAASQRLLTHQDLEYLPTLGDDSIRAVAWLPGTASNGVSARANVRGGEIAETLVRVDGLRLYDPFHLKDFQSIFSTIDPRIVNSMNVYTGGFPATFGDRMSGVIDVRTMPAQQALYHEIGFSFFNSSVLSSGQYADGRGQWLASVRRSNLDLMYGKFSDQPDRPRYTDAFTKIGYEISDRLKITGNVLYSKDDIALSDDVDREESAQADHRDLYAWVGFEHFPSKEMNGRTLLARAELDGYRRGASEKAGVSTGTLADVRSFSIDTIESDWSRHINSRLLVIFGGSASRLEGRYDYADEVEYDLLFDVDGAPTDTSRSRSISVQPTGRQYGLFATLRYDWTERIATEIGARWDKQTLDAAHSDTLGPRLGVRFAFSARTNFRASWGRFHQSQAVNELQVSDGVQEFFAPQRSDHVVIGLDHAFENGVGIRIEGYEKSMQDLRPRYENLLNTMILLPELKPDRIRIAPSSAHARGVELTFDGGQRALQWWASYGWAQVRDRIADESVPRSWDQTDAVSAGLNWDTEKWNASFALMYRSGWPISRVVLDASGETPIASVVGYNSERLDFYRSVDLRLTRKIALARSTLAVSLEIANLFDRNNPCCLEYEIGDEEDTGTLVLDPLYYLPMIPSVGLLWKF